MASRDPLPARRSRRVDLALTIGVFFALCAASLPLLRVVESGAWVPQSLFIAAAVLGAGLAARGARLTGFWVSLIEILVWVAITTALFGRDTAILWLIPTADTLSLVGVLLPSAIEVVAVSAAPLEAGPALSFLLVAAVGVLAIVLDHVVLTARMPLLGAVGLVTVSLIPSIAVPGDVDVFAFALLGASILFLLRVDTRGRQRASAAAAGGAGTTSVAGATTASATALGIGAIAVVVALVAGPLLPTPSRAGGGTAFGGSTINATLELGDDLRQPGAVEVLQMRWSGGGAPYLRVVTLSEFDGRVWDPDETATAPLVDDANDLDPVAVDEGITVTEYRTTVDIVDLNSRWAPVPYPAVDVLGLDDEWEVVPANRTVAARGASVQDRTYEVVSTRPEPTLEQMRARDAGGISDDQLVELPDDMPDVIAETAAEVTAGAGSDYDALVALQAWFRSPSFQYSLDAPVDDGFDGTGVDAIAGFLDARAGYCVHFASAFAVMARTLDMPSRIVVGYLPGTATGEIVDGASMYAVASTQLHAWPEVHFEGVGWVPFEPTNSLGTPTNFLSGATTTPGSAPSQSPGASSGAATPTPTSTTGGGRPDEADAGDAGSSASGVAANTAPLLGTLAAVLVLLVVPAIAGNVRRLRRSAAARRGDAASAWLTVQELAVDLGIPVPAAETPRAFGARLADQRGVDRRAMDVLVSAIERASYAGDSTASTGESLADAVATARAGLFAAVSPSRAMSARLFPRSLVIRPGSAYAGTLPTHIARASN